MYRIILTLFIILAATGCGPRYADYFPYHDDGTIKPHVAFLPMQNSLTVRLPSDITREMTNTIHYELMNSGELYVFSDEDIQQVTNTIGTVDFFDSDQKLVEQFCDADFIVLIDLIDHSQNCCADSNLSQLVIKARLKIIDARCRKPRLALQEIMTRDYLVCAFPGVYEHQNEHYSVSIGRAHRWFADAIAKRLEEVILSAH